MARPDPGAGRPHGAGTSPRARPDVRSAVVTGVATAAWYAVPDVVGPRWARALTKAAVLGAGFGVGLAVTAEGRAARAGIRAASADGEAGATGEAEEDALAAADEEGLAGGQVAPVLAVGALAGAVGLTVVLAVAGEKWAYRRGERWRERGLRLPHTRVGLIVGALAGGLTLLEPPGALEQDVPAAPSR